jgi:hypothetical protein
MTANRHQLDPIVGYRHPIFDLVMRQYASTDLFKRSRKECETSPNPHLIVSQLTTLINPMPQPSVLIVRLSSVISLVKVQVVTVVFGRPAQVPRVSSWRSFSSRTVFLCASSTRSARTASGPAPRASWCVQPFFR